MNRRFSAIVLVVGGAALVRAAGPSTTTANGLTERVSEPVVVTGAQLGHFVGLPADALAVWVFDGRDWQRLPSQVDQRDESGSFVPAEGPDLLDDNDELVFMADRLGQVRPDEAWPPGVSPERPPAQVKAIDPLRPDVAGYAYAFESPAAAPQLPLVSFDGERGEIRSEAYVLGFARAEDGYFGLKRLSLMGDPRNRIDRSKIRITIPLLGDLNEESLGQFGQIGPVEPVIAGPVRLVMDPQGASMAYPARATLFNMQLPEGLPLIPGLEVRLSLDFGPDAAGATYRAENVPRGVPIDGQPDTFLQLVFPMWREVVFEEGRLVLLAERRPTPLLVRTYYKDDATPDEADTGDKMSYGDNGIVANSVDGLADAGFLGQMVALPPGGAVTAEELAEQLANPIVVEVEVEGRGGTIYLPVTARSTPR